MKRIIAVLLAVVMVLSLAACTKDSGNGGSSSNGGSSNDGGSSKTEEKIELTMWCIATESDSNRHAYEAAIADMKTKYPNIDFKWEAFENESYKEKIKAAMSSGAVSDIFFTWSCAFLGDFVKLPT